MINLENIPLSAGCTNDFLLFDSIEPSQTNAKSPESQKNGFHCPKNPKQSQIFATDSEKKNARLLRNIIKLAQKVDPEFKMQFFTFLRQECHISREQSRYTIILIHRVQFDADLKDFLQAALNQVVRRNLHSSDMQIAENARKLCILMKKVCIL